MSSYDCDVSANFFDYFDAGREGTIYSSSTKENKREKTPVLNKPKGKAHAPPRKPRGQPQGKWSGTGEEGDGLDLDDLLTLFVLAIPKAVKNSIPLEPLSVMNLAFFAFPFSLPSPYEDTKTCQDHSEDTEHDDSPD